MLTARLAAAAVLLLALLPLPARASAGPLAEAFAKAAATYDVPADLLVAVAYAETRLDGHDGEPSAGGGYGMMHLVSPGTLERAAELTGQPAQRLRADDAANILGGAAVLGSMAQGVDRKDLAAWYPVVARYSGAQSATVQRLYADAVYEVLAKGLRATAGGETITVAASAVQPERGPLEQARSFAETLSADYPAAHWIPAHSGNYARASRTKVDRVVIHVTQGSYAGAISWFQNPRARVSAHYVIRSRDGDVTQMVRHRDVAWHAGNGSYNRRSIGVEHEGYVGNATWFTDAMYRASAALTRAICDKYGIPKDRRHIVGHNEVPGATHSDPGRHWNWTRYMQLVAGGEQTWSTVVDGPSAGPAWGTSAFSGQKQGPDYRFAKPAQTADPAWFRATLPKEGRYRVDVWYPADPGYNAWTPYLVKDNVIWMNQQVGGGSWQTLGTFTLPAGSQNVVGVSRRTDGKGYVIADAVRITKM
ncbi:N-acetylmuramoyl-L-alanine amidase [Thermoactinospora rubra]|uniref:N-acetylmuramoyl-L-alanine amidase n=1 Tax=Thermoactinospora rubra TaxID=1088767 RepID=UPI000A0FD3D8|nr:N-acetylmuramoyl-L-alanine amidase [Thermoactinospora rubra]